MKNRTKNQHYQQFSQPSAWLQSETTACYSYYSTRFSVRRVPFDLTHWIQWFTMIYTEIKWCIMRHSEIFWDIVIYIEHIYGGFHKYGHPRMDGLQRNIRLEWMIWGYPHWWKPPYIYIYTYIYTYIYIYVYIHIYIYIHILIDHPHIQSTERVWQIAGSPWFSHGSWHQAHGEARNFGVYAMDETPWWKA